MKQVIEILSNNLKDLEQTIIVAENIIEFPNATKDEVFSAYLKIKDAKAKIRETETAMKILNLPGLSDVFPQNEHWKQLERIIEQRPRNSMGTAIAYLAETFLLIKKI
jgi:hypothetical protein